MAGGAIRIEPVSDRAGLRRLIGVTREIYADDPMWVQPLTFERLDHLNQARNPFLRAIEIRYWLQALPLLALFSGLYLSRAFHRALLGKVAASGALAYIGWVGARTLLDVMIYRYH